MAILPAIALHQPWASFIAIGVKPYETRHWSPPLRFIGQRIAIHAAKRSVSNEDREWWRRTAGDVLLPLGGIVCTALLFADVPVEAVPADDYGDYSPGRRAWCLVDIRPIVPAIGAVGRQGFWMWDSGGRELP